MAEPGHFSTPLQTTMSRISVAAAGRLIGRACSGFRASVASGELSHKADSEIMIASVRLASSSDPDHVSRSSL